MMKMFIAQKSRNDSHSVVVWPAKPGRAASATRATSAAKNVWSASPPIQDWMPNQPQATIARISAGRFEPEVP